jgi:hypothetical protein
MTMDHSVTVSNFADVSTQQARRVVRLHFNE